MTTDTMAITTRSEIVRPQQVARSKPTTFKKIIVPIDYSDTSMKALGYASALAGKFGSQLLLIHVLEFPTVFNSSKPAYKAWDRSIEEKAQKRLSETITFEIDELIWATSEVRIGRAYKEICECAKREKADLIVMGTHGFTGIKHVVLGSTAERVVRHAPCSVLTVRPTNGHDAHSFADPRSILVPTDFSVRAETALKLAITMAREHGAQIDLLYVVPINYYPGEFEGLVSRTLEAQETDAAHKKLATLRKGLMRKNIPIATHVRQGRVPTQICDAAKELNSDLIAMSTQGRTRWQHALLGSTTEDVVRQATCPVLCVRKR